MDLDESPSSSFWPIGCSKSKWNPNKRYGTKTEGEKRGALFFFALFAGVRAALKGVKRTLFSVFVCHIKAFFGKWDNWRILGVFFHGKFFFFLVSILGFLSLVFFGI